MVTINGIVSCSAYLATEDAQQCGVTATVEFKYLGREGSLPRLVLDGLPEGWSLREQPDGCEDRHFCPKHVNGDEEWEDRGPTKRLRELFSR